MTTRRAEEVERAVGLDMCVETAGKTRIQLRLVPAPQRNDLEHRHECLFHWRAKPRMKRAGAPASQEVPINLIVGAFSDQHDIHHVNCDPVLA